MKNRFKKIKIAVKVIAVAVLFFSCSLEEYNPSTVSLEVAYKTPEGYEGLLNSCYTNLYFFYGKIDFIGPNEAGTDCWINTGNNDIALCLYNSTLNTSTGNVRVIWNGLYSMINFCNTAIHSAGNVEGISKEQMNSKVAEAYFLRAFANFHLVEQFGNVVLRTRSSALEGIDNSPKRSSEIEFYDQIIEDLEFATKHLPYEQSIRGRVSKKAAYAMLAKVALQRCRLGEEQKYAKMALDAADELISNASSHKCALWERK